MTGTRHGTAVIEFPSELEVLITRKFDAPIQLVYDVFTETEHVRRTIAPFGEVVTECSFDARVGGEYRYTFLAPDDGRDMTFHGEFLEIQPPTHIVDTWHYDGWPDVKAVETVDLSEEDAGHHGQVEPGLQRQGRPRPHDEVRWHRRQLRQRRGLPALADRPRPNAARSAAGLRDRPGVRNRRRRPRQRARR